MNTTSSTLALAGLPLLSRGQVTTPLPGDSVSAAPSASPSQAPAIPELAIKATPGPPPRRELEGWDELNRWGMLHHSQWCALQRRLEMADGMTEADKLRLLAGEMLRMHASLMEIHLAALRMRMPPRFIIPAAGELPPVPVVTEDTGPPPLQRVAGTMLRMRDDAEDAARRFLPAVPGQIHPGSPMKREPSAQATNASPAYDWRPYNSIRFICRCGRKQTFPRAPSGGRKATSEYVLEDGTRKIVTGTTKEVVCPCGTHTRKDREGFRLRVPATPDNDAGS